MFLETLGASCDWGLSFQANVSAGCGMNLNKQMSPRRRKDPQELASRHWALAAAKLAHRVVWMERLCKDHNVSWMPHIFSCLIFEVEETVEKYAKMLMNTSKFFSKLNLFFCFCYCFNCFCAFSEAFLNVPFLVRLWIFKNEIISLYQNDVLISNLIIKQND